MTATITRRGTPKAIDLFCGFGGSSQGIHRAGMEVAVAANHNELAIQCHAANYPDTDHRRADLSNPDAADYIDPITLPKADFLWASPSCKFHSPANAKKLYMDGPCLPGLEDPDFDQVAYANSERSRVTMLCPLRYSAKHRPAMVVIENVVEVAKWGPGKDGTTFQWWLTEWVKLGYRYKILFLNSMFFPPCPQSRDRMYVVLWRKGVKAPDLDYRPRAFCTSDDCGGRHVDAVQTWKQRTAAWPLAQWGKYGAQYVYNCPDCHRRVEPVAWPAYTAIDWSDLGPMLGEREDLGMEPLAPNTLDRIRRGMQKFRGGPPVVIPAKSTWGVDRAVTEALTTQTSQQEKALASFGPFLVKNNGGSSETGYRAKGVDGPVGAITGSPTQAIVNPQIVPLRTNHAPVSAADEQLRTIVAGNVGHAIATEGAVLPVYGNTFERPGQTRGRALHDQLFTQHTTEAFGFAHMPFDTVLRGGGSVSAGQYPVIDPLTGLTAEGNHHAVTALTMSGQTNDSAHNAAMDSLFTATAAGRQILVSAAWTKINGGPGDTAWHGTEDPFGTVVSKSNTGLIVLPWLDQWRSDPAAVTDQFATVMTHLRHSLASIEFDGRPITDDELMRVRFRMLNPDPELRRAMAFFDDYILLGNKTERTAGLGNAVTPPVADWITGQCLAILSGDGVAMAA